MGVQFVTASHSRPILEANLLLSPCLSQYPLHIEWNAGSAASAYNRALDATTAPIIVFLHHDVFLPYGWDLLLRDRIAQLSSIDPDWALFGPFGIGLDHDAIGPVWSSSLGRIVGRVPLGPAPVQSFDELMVVLRRKTGLRFDEKLAGWHLYGTDIVLSASKAGYRSWAGSLPVIHNDRYHDEIGADFAQCYKEMQQKWRSELPVRTPITKISRSGLHLLRDQWHARRSASYRRGMTVATETPVFDLAARCGWSDVSTSISKEQAGVLCADEG
jgi:hypothetical protein